jgi:hypothetical protein
MRRTLFVLGLAAMTVAAAAMAPTAAISGPKEPDGPARRRLHRARPRVHEGRSAGRPARKRDRRHKHAHGRTIGVYPETTHPTYFQSIGLALEPPLVRVLRANRLTGMHDPVIVQSFETANLRRLNTMIDVKLVQLVDATGKPYDFVFRAENPPALPRPLS